MAITVHHLNNSKSQRILWTLEELGLEYELITHQRQPSFAAPDAIKSIHPLGKAPVVIIDEMVMAESGAVVQYLIEQYAADRLMPSRDSKLYGRYLEFMHYPEGSLSPPLLDRLFIRMLNVEHPAFNGFTTQRIQEHLSYVEGLLTDNEYLVGDTFSGADIQITFNLQGANVGGGLASFPNLSAFVERMESREAYQRAIEKGGPFDLSFKPSA